MVNARQDDGSHSPFCFSPPGPCSSDRSVVLPLPSLIRAYSCLFVDSFVVTHPHPTSSIRTLLAFLSTVVQQRQLEGEVPLCSVPFVVLPFPIRTYSCYSWTRSCSAHPYPTFSMGTLVATSPLRSDGGKWKRGSSLFGSVRGSPAPIPNSCLFALFVDPFVVTHPHPTSSIRDFARFPLHCGSTAATRSEVPLCSVPFVVLTFPFSNRPNLRNGSPEKFGMRNSEW